ncbi:MAG: T9SS C-terminal target domain-containing protein [Flavobacteriales bacterium]|nr:MAG: T9SS C-terminal target domain-containing protein [Flavobacteriales bacterium]
MDIEFPKQLIFLCGGKRKYVLQLLILLNVFFIGETQAQDFPVINEACNHYFNSVVDREGDGSAWVELYNPTDSVISMNAWYLSSDTFNLRMYPLPDTLIYPGKFLLIALSGKYSSNTYIIDGHFAWSKDQPRLFLSDSVGVRDQIHMPDLPYDHSYGRVSDGDSLWEAFRLPTPGATNFGAKRFVPITEQLTVWPFSGWYQVDSIRLEVGSSASDLEIRYAFQGFSPEDSSAFVYSNSAWIYPHQSDTFAWIPTTVNSLESLFRWRQPQNVPSFVNTLSIAGYRNGERVTPYYYRHYFMQRSAPSFNLPVISIQTPPDNLFGFERGIYVPGRVHAETPVTSWPWGTGNFHERGRAWERLAHLSFFEPDGSLAFEQNLGLRIHGGGSRALPMKSLRLYPRGIYGESRLRYQFFPERDFTNYNRILLRNSGQDFVKTMFTDAMVSHIVAPLDLDRQLSQAAVHYINGEFWGVINIRDRIDEHFISYTRNVPEEQVELIEVFRPTQEEEDNGWSRFMLQLYDFDDYNDDGFFDFMEEHLDIDNLIDYLIVRLYIGSFDWPGNNRMVWRDKRGGRFRNILFDNDHTLERYDFNTFELALNPNGPFWPNPRWSTALFRAAMQNDIFLEKFIARNAWMIKEIFAPERLTAILDSFVELYEPVMFDQISRWQKPGENIGAWYFYLQFIREFIVKRPCFMRQFTIDQFNLHWTYLAELECENRQLENSSQSSKLRMEVFPNPSDGQFTLAGLITPYSKVKISVSNTLGQTVHNESSFIDASYLIKHFDLRLNLQPGVYYIRVENEGAVAVLRYIKN